MGDNIDLFVAESIKKEMKLQKKWDEARIRIEGGNVVPPQSSKKFSSKVMKLLMRDTRINDLKKDMQNQGYYMLDSSYIRPGDPCSMRNLGEARNVIWNYEVGSNYNTSSAIS